MIDNVTTQWPLPWGGVLYRLQMPDAMKDQPVYVRQAAARVEKEGAAATAPNSISYSLDIDTTNLPNVVRGFDALGREQAQSQASISWNGETTAVRLAVGAQSSNRYDHQALVLDNSYVAQRIGNAAVYAGYLTHWWGPGWTSALSLSNNARPFPQIGITRIDTTGFRAPLFSWIGPWQAEFFVGVLDGKRIAENTLFNGLRFSFSPIKGLELGLARTEQLCGTGHPCKPVAEFFNVKNDPTHISKSKDETNFDIRYTGLAWGTPYSIYTQVMDRDTGPFVHSDSSHVFGASVWLPVARTLMRVTAEYASTISTQNFFSFGKYFYGTTYTDVKYIDGWQYRDRTLGMSLDTDSRLASLQASWMGKYDVTYSLTYYNASIGAPLTPPGINIVSSAPVTIDIGEARVSFPLRALRLDAALRFQDDQPRPQKGAAAAAELRLVYSIR